MIKFFRKIRQKLLSENKFSKYLIYAIGEIVLVVIGILIALQINNWNEERKVIIGLDEQLHSMTNELEQDIIFFKELIERDEKRIGFLRSLIVGNYDTLELTKAPGIISFNYDQRAFGTAYLGLKQRGEVNLIDNPQLREVMVAYFEEVCVEFNNRSAWHKEFVTTNVEPYIMSHLEMDSTALTRPEIVLKELKTTELKNIVSLQLWNHKRTDRHAHMAMASASELIEMINKTLSNQ
jgi:hypothetical protein